MCGGVHGRRIMYEWQVVHNIGNVPTDRSRRHIDVGEQGRW
jgi:hypothetical protein